jgi:NitT/TauT family transport system permease protein
MSLAGTINPAVETSGPGSAGSGQSSFWAARGKQLIVKLAFFGGLIVLWQFVVMMKWVPSYVFPSPMDVLRSFREMAEAGELHMAIFKSLSRMAAGYSISVVGGLVVGVLAARSWIFKETIGSLIVSLQSLPSVCWLPFAMLWVGITEKAILVVLILGALFSIAVATEGAIRNIAPIYVKVGRVLGARGFTFAKDILFFAALPELIGGLKLGWTFAWRSLMAAELIRIQYFGVGRLLEVGRNNNDVAYMLAAMIIILVIGLAVDGLVFGTIERKIRRRYGLEKR